MSIKGYIRGNRGLVKGIYLLPETKAEVLRKYDYRHMTNLYNNDDDVWLSTYAFYVKKDGSLDNRYNHCMLARFADNDTIG